MKVVVTYEDGTEQVVLEKDGPLSIDMRSDQEKPGKVTVWEGDTLPKPQVQCEDFDVLSIRTLVMRDQPVEVQTARVRELM